MQRQPSHHADDIGARFALPSAFSELPSTTGGERMRTGGTPELAAEMRELANGYGKRI